MTSLGRSRIYGREGVIGGNVSQLKNELLRVNTIMLMEAAKRGWK